MKEKTKHKWLNAFQILSTGIAVLITILYWDQFRTLTVSHIVDASANTWITAILIVMLYYVLKSFIMIVPVLVIQIAVGVLFPLPLALLVNIIGLMVTLSISYGMGRLRGRNYVHKLIVKYPKSAIIQTMPNKNPFIFCFIIHSLSIFPMNMIGMFCGALNIGYKYYFYGALFGSLVRVVSVTVMGTAATDPTSPTFLISLAVTLLVSLGSYLSYRMKIKKETNSDPRPSDS